MLAQYGIQETKYNQTTILNGTDKDRITDTHMICIMHTNEHDGNTLW